MAHTSYNNLADSALLKTFLLTKRQEILGVLLDRHAQLLYGIGLKFLKDSDEAQDAVQQVFLKILSAPPTEYIENFKGWLYIIIRNHCFQELKKQHRHSDIVEIDENSFVNNDDTKDHLLSNATLDEMHAAMDVLNEEQAYCIREFYLAQKSYGDIMEKKNFTFAQVKSHIQNGKRNLKNTLLLFLKGKE